LVKSEQKIEEYKLDNGLRIILAPNDKENKVYMNMVYLTGSLNDPKGKGGLAHLLEHLAFKGTKNVPGDEFQRRLDQYGLMKLPVLYQMGKVLQNFQLLLKIY
jgi:zinc protease